MTRADGAGGTSVIVEISDLDAFDETGSGSGVSGRGEPTQEERRFLANLLSALADSDPEAYAALTGADAGLAEMCAPSDDVRRRLREALCAMSDDGAAGKGQAPGVKLPGVADDPLTAGPLFQQTGPGESHGILTSVTRKLPPGRAIELYRKIAPGLAHHVLRMAAPESNLEQVRLVVDHLCSAEVQARLRANEHVRDGILDEICAVLGRSGICGDVTRDDLESYLERCGAIDDLNAMQNCIRLSATKAG